MNVITPVLDALRIADAPESWRALGFSVDVGGGCGLGGVTIELTPASPGGIVGWSLPEIDGLGHIGATPARPTPAEHPNGATGLDHVVVLTPDFDRTAGAFADAGLEFRRIRDAGGFRQGFRRAGPAIVEVVEAAGAPPGPARLWGLVPVVEDLDALRERLGSALLSEPKPAVQPGRRIATVRPAARLTCAMAFMTSAT
ncbi:MAG TPA: hypothetical protein VLP43_03040 [Solirubrobacteraceae bacterium]|nr:hypothetical protein [Solirubrobacteraceae bacterium]